MNVFSFYSSYEKLIITFIISINLVSFLIYGLDKLKAKTDRWRIPEFNLLLLGLLGGGIGSIIGMVIFKHKLSKKKFFIGVPILIIINFISFLYLFPIIKELI